MDYKNILWTAFAETGMVRDYLKYKLFEEERMKMEAGEEFGVDKDIGNSVKNHEVR